MIKLKRLDECGLNRNIVYKALGDKSLGDNAICFTDFYQLETDIVNSFGMNILKTLEPYVMSSLQSLSSASAKQVHELLPYISYIQSKYGHYTVKCKKGNFYNKELDVHIRIKVNSSGSDMNQEPPLEAFKLVKWFIEINTKKQVPKELLKFMEQEEALEILKG